MYPSYFPVGYQPSYVTQPQPSITPQAVAAPTFQPATPSPIMDSGLTYVNGIEEVASWVVQRGQSVYLFDRNQNTFYVKSVSDNGMPNPIEVYDYVRRELPSDEKTKEQAAPAFNPDDFVRREELDVLRAQLDELRKREEEDE